MITNEKISIRKQEKSWITRKPLNFKGTIQRFNLTILIPQLERFGYIVKGESEKWVYWLEGKKERIPFFCSKEESERWGLKTAKIIEVARITLQGTTLKCVGKWS